MRVKRGVTRHARHQKMITAAKGMQHGRRRSFRMAKQAVTRALQYAYRDRRTRKRDFRRLWVIRINNALKPHGISYSRFIAALTEKQVRLDRKSLSELAVSEPAAFEAVVKLVVTK